MYKYRTKKVFDVDTDKKNIPPSPFGDKDSEYLGRYMHISTTFTKDKNSGEMVLTPWNPDTIWETMIGCEHLGIVAVGGRRAKDNKQHPPANHGKRIAPADGMGVLDTMSALRLFPDDIDMAVAVSLNALAEQECIDELLSDTGAKLLYSTLTHGKALYGRGDIMRELGDDMPFTKHEHEYITWFTGKVTEEIARNATSAVLSRGAYETLLTYQLFYNGRAVRDPRKMNDVDEMAEAVRLMSFGMIELDASELRPIPYNQQAPGLAMMYKTDAVSNEDIARYEMLMGLNKIWAGAWRMFAQQADKEVKISDLFVNDMPFLRKPNIADMYRISEEIGCVDEMVKSLVKGVPAEDIIA